MVCSYNPKTQRASMLSIPRDTFVGKNKAKASGNNKINALYTVKGVEATVEAVEEITGMSIDYYAVINNQVVIDLVNIIGGVEFDVPINMNYDDKTQNLHIHLNKGKQVLNGDQAEQLLRFRHNNNGSSYSTEYGDNDFGRMKTQRAFMIEVIKQTLKITNITHIKTIMTTIFENLETDIQLNDLFPYVPHAVNFDTENIVSDQVPGASVTYNNLWFFEYDEEETKKIVDEMYDYLYAIERQSVTNSVNETNTINKVKSANEVKNVVKNNISNAVKNKTK